MAVAVCSPLGPQTQRAATERAKAGLVAAVKKVRETDTRWLSKARQVDLQNSIRAAIDAAASKDV